MGRGGSSSQKRGTSRSPPTGFKIPRGNQRQPRKVESEDILAENGIYARGIRQ